MANEGSGGGAGGPASSYGGNPGSVSIVYGTGGRAEGSGGGGGSSTPYAEFPADFDARVMLLEPNVCIGGVEVSRPWVCLGIVPEIHPTKNVWLQRR